MLPNAGPDVSIWSGAFVVKRYGGRGEGVAKAQDF